MPGRGDNTARRVDTAIGEFIRLDVDGRTALFVAAGHSVRRFDAMAGEPWPAGS